MKFQPLLSATVGLATWAAVNVSAQEPPRLSVLRSGDAVEFSWPATVPKADGAIDRPYFELQRSLDLRGWQPIGERLRAANAVPGQSMNATIALDEQRAFYRLLSITPRQAAKLASGGAEVFGYGEAFARELQRLGQISPGQFAALFPTVTNYLPGLSWDPTTAKFWDQFNTNIALVNQGKAEGTPGWRSVDYRFTPAELEVFKKNGFVVSERLGSYSFADAFYKLWKNDLPVFISCDAILQAWHRTFDAMLEELEETYLFNSVEKMLAGMAAQLTLAYTQAVDAQVESIRDADYFLAVARSLLAGNSQPLYNSKLGQEARVAETLADVGRWKLVMKPDIMGSCRMVDFSQFIPRGHYTHTDRLRRYFQCVMWLGRTDLAVAGGPFNRGCGDQMASPRELGTAIVLWHLLKEAREFERWQSIDRVIQTFVGWTDSMTFAQLDSLLSAAGIRTLSDAGELGALEKLQTDILQGKLGAQNIRSDFFVSPLGPEQVQLPRSFTVLGQKFVPDSWVFSQTVFSSVLWDGSKVSRRVPSALDAAFAALGNNQIVPELVARIANPQAQSSPNHAERWRDGMPYQHNLAAARAVIDAQTPESWDSNLYLGWLGALRELSAPTTDVKYPEVMRTRAWSLKTLNTQLASWTQLRHDTVLYAKQSYTDVPICFYPAGFVEPRPEFWERLRRQALRAAELIRELKFDGNYSFFTASIPMSAFQSNQRAHLQRFADTVSTLQTLSAKELRQECFTPEDELFVRNLVEEAGWLPFGSGTRRKFDGWYPRLFYRPMYHWNDTDFHTNYGSDSSDLLVTDVHTDLPSPLDGDPGSVLHEGVGRVNLLLVAVENGPDRMIFAGPVLSHYEFEVVGAPRRLTDDDWKLMIESSFKPVGLQGLQPPAWTRSFLVPR